MTTIPRNHKRKVAAVAARYPFALVYTLENYYRGDVVEAVKAWDALNDKTLPGKLTLASDERKATIHIHGRRWYELWPSAEAYEASRTS